MFLDVSSSVVDVRRTLERSRMQIVKLFLGHGKDFGIYSECNGEPRKCFKAGEFVGLIYTLTGFLWAPV